MNEINFFHFKSLKSDKRFDFFRCEIRRDEGQLKSSNLMLRNVFLSFFLSKICFSFFHSKTYQTGIEWQVKTSNARKIEENFRMKNKNSLADIDLLFHVEKQIIDVYSFFHSNSLFSKMADQFDFNFSLSFLSSFCLVIFQYVSTSFLTRIPWQYTDWFAH